jgi:hypothetical protein
MTHPLTKRKEKTLIEHGKRRVPQVSKAKKDDSEFKYQIKLKCQMSARNLDFVIWPLGFVPNDRDQSEPGIKV